MTTKDKSKKSVDDDDEVIEIPDLDEEVTETKDEAVLENKEESTKKTEPKPDNKLKKLWKKYLEKKKITIPATILVVIALLAAIPFTRYSIAGLAIKQAIGVSVIDSKTGKPVSEAEVTIAGIAAKTDGQGLVRISGIKVGPKNVKVTKKYYQDSQASVLIPIKGAATTEFKLQATGRQVPVKITNSINEKAVKGVSIKSGESEALTDDKGQAVLVLSPNSENEKATISSNGYNSVEVSVKVTDVEAPENTFKVTPSGKIYFLSKKSGKVDVIKTNLDGTDRQTVLAGTGNENEFSTTLLASRDWKYLTLHAKRDDKDKLYLIDTSNDQLSTIDEGDASFSPVGWYNQNFVFTVSRSNIQYWQEKQTALKSFNAETKQLKTLDESRAEGTSDNDYASEQFGQIYILENELVYHKTWSADYYSGGKIIGKKNSVNSVRPDGSDKKVAREFDAKPKGNSYMNSKLYKPQEVYFLVSEFTQNIFYEYEEGKLEEDSKVTLNEFEGYYPTFLVSPSGTKTFWHEPRDGKNTLFTGGKNADEAKEIAALAEYVPYGWFSDEFILVSKNSSELYISGQNNVDKPLKVSDYHKPNNSFTGYGYGYGGL